MNGDSSVGSSRTCLAGSRRRRSNGSEQQEDDQETEGEYPEHPSHPDRVSDCSSDQWADDLPEVQASG